MCIRNRDLDLNLHLHLHLYLDLDLDLDLGLCGRFDSDRVAVTAQSRGDWPHVAG